LPLVAFVIAATTGRGGILATLIPVLLAALFLGHMRKIRVGQEEAAAINKTQSQLGRLSKETS
jgi:hypothetical protein